MPRGLSKLSACVARGLSSTSVAVRPKKVGIQTRPGRVPDGPGLAYFIAGDGDQPVIKPGARVVAKLAAPHSPFSPFPVHPRRTVRGHEDGRLFWGEFERQRRSRRRRTRQTIFGHIYVAYLGSSSSSQKGNMTSCYLRFHSSLPLLQWLQCRVHLRTGSMREYPVESWLGAYG